MNREKRSLESVGGDWERQLSHVVEAVRQNSLHADPKARVRTYTARMREVLPTGRLLSLSRRGAIPPQVLITRDSAHEDGDGRSDPPAARPEAPMIEGGLLSELIFSNEARLIDDLRIDPTDPAAAYLAEYRSLVALPVFDGGEAMDVLVFLRREPNAFDAELMPQLVWASNLLGESRENLVLSTEVMRAHDLLDQEMKLIAEIQASLLPADVPRVPTLDLAAYYKPVGRAGGDYYDFFSLPDDRLGIFIADVAGHGSAATVLMAITQTLAHTHPSDGTAAELFNYINRHLFSRYTQQTGTFVTAFVAVYDPATRGLTYSSAGHNPPRLRRHDGSTVSFDGARGLPLGVTADQEYEQTALQLAAGDQIVFYTDGITEAMNGDDELFGVERLDRVLHRRALDAAGLIDAVLDAVHQFTDGREADDDRTIVAARVTE